MRDDSLESEMAALRETLRTLRGEDGCPWDRERTMGDMASFLIDEAYELLHAVHGGDIGEIEDELGDVLFIIVFIHELILGRGGSPLSGILSGGHGKILRRHPHVFGEARAEDQGESLRHWERAKKGEKARKEGSSVLDEVPAVLPPLRRALKMQKKAASTGFDWTGHEGVIDKLGEETGELLAAVERNDREGMRDETGDLLFTLVNLARVLHVDCESALAGTTEKFDRRFRWMEREAAESGRSLEEMDIDEMESLWQRSKTGE